MNWYLDKRDARVLLALNVYGANRLVVISGRLGLHPDTVTRLARPWKLAGLVSVWYRGIAGPNWCIAYIRLTDKGKAYADQLARELGENEVQRLLTPKPSKGKRAPIRKLEGKNLADSLGL